ncbi:MAG: aldehyde dehydrogenase family protein [Clostridiales Family XIII bacterium]|jgi:acyl-CoA reductase-like NAD-dependent aldehyde dehydrogenase|nr:aldehyde dehydrogenase family protein [Clostridiales Family XIII bacterium]
MSEEMLYAKNYINGEWVDGEGEEKQVISPIDGKSIGSFRAASEAQVDAAVKSAKAAQKEWARVSLREKCDLLEEASKIGFEKYADDMARNMTREMGKIHAESVEEVMELGLPNLLDAVEEAKRFRTPAPPSTFERENGKKLVVKQEAIGVVASVTPWNFPIALIAEYTPYALVLGNTSVFKPTSFCPFTGQDFIKCFVEAGFPKGVVNFVLGPGSVGTQLFRHDLVDCITFTGSTEVGLIAAKEGGLKRRVLELGGNGPMIIMDDADIDAAVDASIVGIYYNAGQVCSGAERLLVHEAVYEEFSEKFIAKVSKMKTGDPFDPSVAVGPLHDATGLEKVIRHIDDAVAKGAKVVLGGGHKDLYFEPTVITNVSADAQLNFEETFGPVAPLIPFKDREEAVEIANNTMYGLSSAAFTSGLNNAWFFADNLQHGTVLINEHTNYWDYLAPFGGAKKSGNGRILGPWILNCLSETKLVIMDTSKSKY